MIIEDDPAALSHYGILRKSGRYPWGSGGTEVARSKSFLDYVAELRRQGLTDVEIAAGLSSEEHPFTTTELRNTNTLARNIKKRDDIDTATKLRDKGWSPTAIGRKMERNESSVRALLKEGEQQKLNVLHETADFLRAQVDKLGVVDIGKGVEHLLNLARNKLDTAISILKDEGYEVHKVQVDQSGTGNKTTIKVLAKPGTTYRDIASDVNKIKMLQGWTEDQGASFTVIKPPLNLDSKRLKVMYDEDGGSKQDGLIYVREGVPDLSLGKSRYAQVRIAVDGTHYIKGMAMYHPDIPPGVDIVFHTNKKKADVSSDLDALKELKTDPTNPFGSLVRQIGDKNDQGQLTKVTSVMNLVNEQGDWENWAQTLSSQMLSKQSPKLAKQQLDLAYEMRKNQLDEINTLTNPLVKQKLLEDFADNADSAAVQLKAHKLPGTANHVILPLDSLKPTEIYAPNYNTGDRVALIRHPHGGTFEIPELTVNNRHPQAKRLLGNAPDAVAINSKVAEQLSGADFDGDTVLVIPNNHGQVKATPALHELKDFDPKRAYPPYDGMKTIDGGKYNEATGKVEYGPKGPTSYKQKEMGVVSNLITDMTIRGASPAEIARAVKHSMVVIDAEKHKLNYRKSAIDNGIPQLKEKYQKPYADEVGSGASTLISRAKSDVRVPKYKPRSYAKGGPIDPATGKKVFEDQPESFTTKDGKLIIKTQSAKRLAVTDDAHTLSSGQPIESIYADHSNKLKALANTARKEAISVEKTPYSPSAAKAYKKEVDELTAALKVAESNAPKERQAQVLAKTTMQMKLAANPHMDRAEYKKTSYLVLAESRARLGAKKTPVVIEPRHWEAIQAGAITPSKLSAILKNTDIQKVKELATPKSALLMTSAKTRRAQSLLASGLTQAEVAQVLGVSLTTLKRGINPEGGS